jgi:hypothetical protein
MKRHHLVKALGLEIRMSCNLSGFVVSEYALGYRIYPPSTQHKAEAQPFAHAEVGHY